MGSVVVHDIDGTRSTLVTAMKQSLLAVQHTQFPVSPMCSQDIHKGYYVHVCLDAMNYNM